MTEAKIPDDLQQLYRDCLFMFIDYVSLTTAQKLIERIAALEAQLAEAQGTIARLSEPLSDEEWRDNVSVITIPSRDFDPDEKFLVMHRCCVDALIAARLAPPQDAPQEKP